MARLIDADKALEVVFDQGLAHPNAYHLTNYATLILREARTVDAAPVVHGRWIDRPTMKGQVYCSECATLEKETDSNYRSRHCPNCGARMDGGKDNGC